MAHRLFVSHKHADKALARQIAEFIDEKTGGRVDIHLSSDPEYGGPVPGRELNRQLREALWQTEALLLVYTFDDGRDWSYCMWECGVATRADSPETNVIVLQCGADVPTPYAQDVRVNIRLLDDLQRFVDMLLRNCFFATQQEALLPNLKSEFVRRYSSELFDRLKPHWPVIDPREVPEWPIWPRVTLSISDTFVQRIRQMNEGRIESAVLALRGEATVTSANALACQMLGAGAASTINGPFGPILDRWERGLGRRRQSCVRPLAEQLVDGLTGTDAVFKRCPRASADAADLQPLLAAVRQIDAEARFEFELLFIDAEDPRAALVADCMIPMRRACYLALADDSPSSLSLLRIRDELTNQDRRRIPILGPLGEPRYIARRRHVDRFFADVATGRIQGRSAAELTLADVLEHPGLAAAFSDSFVVVNDGATVAQAHEALRDRHAEAEDIFVTADGTAASSALGWLPL